MEPLPFSKLLGLSIVSVAPDCVKAELPVREDLCTRPSVLHGGAVMAFADTLGAIATMVWQTKITRGDGRLAAIVTQTQLVLPAKS